MAETDKRPEESAVPPTVRIPNVNVPDPTTGREPDGVDVVKAAENMADDPDKAAKDGLA